jgi:hypothetical protein
VNTRWVSCLGGMILAVAGLVNVRGAEGGRQADSELIQILVNHIGYDSRAAKFAVIEAPDTAGLTTFALVEVRGRDSTGSDAPFGTASASGPVTNAEAAAANGPAKARREALFEGTVLQVGPVDGWKGRFYWMADFSAFEGRGRFRLLVRAGGRKIGSEAFDIRPGLLPETCLSDILFYFKSQRCAGEFDRADRSVPFFGGREDRVDVHGGWQDAAGDFSKYLTHLSYATYMNPQQAPLVVWSLLAARDLLRGSASERLLSLVPRAEDEALHGADWLVRMQDPEGYFYTTVFDQWTHDPAQREICSFKTQIGNKNDAYRAGFRMGGGVAIAALARASTLGKTRDFNPAAYLAAAERGFRHLQAHNREYLNDGRENILDDYCALLAAAELHAATGREEYLRAARARADSLCRRLSRDEKYDGWWRAGDDGERPYFHAVEAGLPVVALLRYLEVEPDKGRKTAALEAIRRSLEFELAVTGDVPNPFGYARQYVKEPGGVKHAAFFMPHDNETGYWWQGENARLASLAAAAWQASRLFEPPLRDRLRQYAVRQTDWILGLNPFDACMLQGRGRNNPDYLPGYPDAPGGICNGVTAGFSDPHGIAFLPPEYADNPSHNWRWSEQWLPHGAWMFLALASMEASLR